VEGATTGSDHLRIGELSRRVGVSAELLRAWERRYQLLTPTRTPGGFRLYGDDDERRIRRMLEHLDSGISAAEAARLARDETFEPAAAPETPGQLNEQAGAFRRALDTFDEAGAHAAFDRLLASFALETVLREALLPYLREIGERWGRGEMTVAQEHFASALIRGRLLGLARGWGGGGGPLALLACLPGDQHDLGLICFGLALRGHGWRIVFLGTDTPLATTVETARELRPALVVCTATLPQQIADARTELEALARSAPAALAGAAATPELAASVGARYLYGDPVDAAAAVAAAR
jgi:DNA-binding transcriptional MerR regulator